jgi:hypothetical protein
MATLIPLYWYTPPHERLLGLQAGGSLSGHRLSRAHVKAIDRLAAHDTKKQMFRQLAAKVDLELKAIRCSVVAIEVG